MVQIHKDIKKTRSTPPRLVASKLKTRSSKLRTRSSRINWRKSKRCPSVKTVVTVFKTLSKKRTMTNSHSTLNFNSPKLGMESILNCLSTVPSSQPVSGTTQSLLDTWTTPMDLSKTIEKYKTANKQRRAGIEKFKEQINGGVVNITTVVTAPNSYSKLTGSSITFAEGSSSSLAPAFSESRMLSVKPDLALYQFLHATRLAFIPTAFRHDVITYLEKPDVREMYRLLGDKNRYLFNESKRVFPQEVFNAPSSLHFLLGANVPSNVSWQIHVELKKMQEEQIAKKWIKVVTCHERHVRVQKKRKLMGEGDGMVKNGKRQCIGGKRGDGEAE